MSDAVLGELPEWRATYADRMMGSHAAPLAMIVRGEGCQVWDETGKRYLDFLGGIAVNSLGYAHPALVNAVSQQMGAVSHVSNYFTTPPQLELAARLQHITGAGERGRVYFCNSGAEAIEAALKLSRLVDGGGRSRLVALTTGFHGRTMGALSITGKAALREPFEPLLPNVLHIEATLDALEAAIDDSVAALIVEPIQGEAGVVELPDGFLEKARELTSAHGALLIIDEIQTGIARTGTWFMFQQFGIVPDAVVMAKGLGGGVPIGALVTFGDASDLFQTGHHGSTYAGNPLVTAAGAAVLREIEESDLSANAVARGEQLRAGIAALGSPLVAETRGRGLLIGVGLTAPVAPAVAAAALDAGLIVNAANESSIRLAPPLTIGDAEVAEFLSIFATALEASV